MLLKPSKAIFTIDVKNSQLLRCCSKIRVLCLGYVDMTLSFFTPLPMDSAFMKSVK